MEHNLIEAIKGLNEEELILAKEVISGKDELIRHKDVLISELKNQLDSYESNPIRAELIKLLNHDINVKELILDLSGVSDIRTTIENEVDEQVSYLKDDVLDEVDAKLDDQFSRSAFGIAVDEHLRRKF